VSDIPFLRPVRASDFDQIHALAQITGGGMTNLPMDPVALRKRIDFSLESYAANVSAPGGEVYMLVLEQAGKVIGAAAVFSAIGLQAGFVNYRINTLFHYSEQLGQRQARQLLQPTHDFTGAAEVGSLFVSPDARGGGFGEFLSRPCYLFIAEARHLFADIVCAELRGWREPDGSQPFWDAVGSHFFGMDFEAADQHNSLAGNQFIADLMPPYPIYISLLPEKAQAAIGVPHKSARPAYEMLLREGFEYTGYVDIFDAGPLVSTPVDRVRTISESVVRPAAIGPVSSDGVGHLVAAGAGARFRAVRADIVVTPKQIHLTSDVAGVLEISEGDPVRAVAWQVAERRQHD